MLWKFTRRMLAETDGRGLWKFAFNFGLRSLLSMRRFKRRLSRGACFPPVLFISITNRCNLRCQGCWATAGDGDRSLSIAALDRIITQAKRRGNYFFGLLGGEPMLHEGLWELIARHGECYFQVLTNGTLITAASAAAMRRLGNVTPLISIEGGPAVSDQRRGGRDVYRRTMRGLEHCRRNRLIVGAATSVCKSNIDELATDSFVRELIDRGVHYMWYYVYRPVGPDPAPRLALSGEQIARLRRFTVETRLWAPLLIVDAYWDHQGRALCPAVAGVSHHVGPSGDLEPCPPIQFATENVADGRDLYETITSSRFLADFRSRAAAAGRGCVLLSHPDLLQDLVVRHSARDTSGRGTALAELSAMRPRADHDMPGCEIPERHWMYRLAKKHWFFGFGAYG